VLKGAGVDVSKFFGAGVLSVEQERSRSLKNVTLLISDHYAVCRLDIGCQAKFLTCEISDFTPCTHAHSNILHIRYAEKSDD